MESVDQSQTSINKLLANQRSHECQEKRSNQVGDLNNSDHSVKQDIEADYKETAVEGKTLPTIEGKKLEFQAISLPALSNHEFQELIKDPTVDGYSLGLLKETNSKLRKQVKHMENLGVLVTDFKQENQSLVEQNIKLQKRIEELEEISKMMHNGGDFSQPDVINEKGRSPAQTSPLQMNSTDPDLVFADEPTTSKNRENSSLVVTESASGVKVVPESPTHPHPPRSLVTSEPGHNVKFQIQTNGSEGNVDEDDRSDDVTSIFLNEANNADIIKKMVTSSKNDAISGITSQTKSAVKLNLTDSSVENDNKIFNEQIRQLEEMGLGSQTFEGNEASIGEPSVTSQFTKLAAVFAGLAQRVVQSQKKMKYSQAFCNALMAENEKIKLRLNQTNQQLETIRREKDEIKQTTPGPPNSHSSVTKMKKQTSSSSPDRDVDSPILLKLQARIKKLEGQRSEILRVNKSWDTQYKKLKQELDRRTKALDSSSRDICDCDISAISRNLSYEQKRRKEVEFHLDAMKKQIESHIQEKSEITRSYTSTHAQCQALKREISHLKETQRKLKGDKSCLEAENLRLNQALEASHSIHERRSPSFPEDNLTPLKPNLQSAGNDLFNLLSSIPESSSQDGEASRPSVLIQELNTKIEVLQEQVKIYREDFETERRDRETCQGDKQRLEERLTRSKHEIQALTQQVCQHEQDFRREKRDKERLQRQLRWFQDRESGNPRTRDRYHGDVTEPPAYYAHRFTANDEDGRFNRSSSRRRIRPPPPLYNMNPDWLTNNDADADAELSYPPDDAAERRY